MLWSLITAVTARENDSTMGCTQSTPDAAVPTIEKSKAHKSSLSTVKPGYSSGDSSSSVSEHGANHGTCRASTSSRTPGGSMDTTNIDTLGLADFVKSMKAKGELHETVVRIETPFGIPIEDIYDGVHMGPILGSGVAGIVRLIKHKSTGVEYAVKCLDLALIRNELVLKQLRDEIYIMCQLDHPNILRLKEVYEGESEIYLVQELCLGGDLFDRLDQQPNYYYSENQCARLVKQMLSSVRYLHSKKIIHRDLKLENFLFSSQSSESELKMIDFGLSKHFHYSGEMQHEAVGTPYTAAPEIIKGSYDERCDMWAVGVITYLLLSGETPFGGCDGENLIEVRDRILTGVVAYEPKEIWKNISAEAKDFINKCLMVDYSKRPTAKQAQRHLWLKVNKNAIGKIGDSSCHLNPNIVKSLVAFKEYSDIRKLLCEVLGFTLLPDQILGLRGEFEKLDTGGCGEISLGELKQVLLGCAEDGSLGALQESEVDDIFNALRVNKTETTIRWHEFIAAGLSQCAVDERNLKLAFDRLDTDRTGSVTFDNVMELLGSNSGNREELQRVWMSSLEESNCGTENITYQDFLLLMKGQPGDQDSEFTKKGISMGCGFQGNKSPMRTLQVNSKESQSPLSRSDDNEGSVKSSESEQTRRSQGRSSFQGACSRAVVLPGQYPSNVENVTKDETKSTLVVNKTIYRAHREMRLAVMDASKRFEATRNRRSAVGPGLVMRRGSLLDGAKQAREYRETARIDRGKQRTGRQRYQRTASDLTGMFPTTPTILTKAKVRSFTTQSERTSFDGGHSELQLPNIPVL